MSFLRAIARGYLVDRMVRGGRPPHRRSRWGTPPPSPWFAPPRPRHRHPRSGFGFYGPFPTYRTRTRRGSHVSVSGCCLPIPLALSLTLGGVLAARRRGRHRAAGF